MALTTKRDHSRRRNSLLSGQTQPHLADQHLPANLTRYQMAVNPYRLPYFSLHEHETLLWSLLSQQWPILLAIHHGNTLPPRLSTKPATKRHEIQPHWASNKPPHRRLLAHCSPSPIALFFRNNCHHQTYSPYRLLHSIPTSIRCNSSGNEHRGLPYNPTLPNIPYRAPLTGLWIILRIRRSQPLSN